MQEAHSVGQTLSLFKGSHAVNPFSVYMCFSLCLQDREIGDDSRVEEILRVCLKLYSII